VCDTGSIDTTREIAALYGATVLSVPWKNDFSSARNSAINASTCSWIFWMDADDVLDPQSKCELINLWRTAGPVAAAFRISCGQETTGYGEFMQVRLFPRKKDVLFERRVHEQIMFSAARQNIPFMHYPLVRIIHTGYNDPMSRRTKARRNKPLILAELKECPNDPALLLNYGDCCMILEERDNAYKAYQCIAQDRAMYDTYPEVFVQAVINIAGLHHSKKEYDSAIVWLMACLNLDPTRTEALFLLGLAHEAKRNFSKAFDCFLAAAQGNGALRQTATNTFKIKIQSIYHCAQLLLSNRYYSQAEELLTHAIEAFPQVVEYYTLLGQASIKQEKLKEAALAFLQSLSLSPDKNVDAYIGMALVYAQLHDLGKAREYLKMGNVELPV
jgi:Tfp pilus assembly protein PilF